MQETLVQFLGLEDPLEKGKPTHSSILGLPLCKESTCYAGDMPLDRRLSYTFYLLAVY